MSAGSCNLGGPELPQPRRRRGPGKKKYSPMSIQELKFPPLDMDLAEIEAARITSGYYPPLEKMLEWFPRYRGQTGLTVWFVPASGRPATDAKEPPSKRRRGRSAARTEPDSKPNADVKGGPSERPTPQRRRRGKKATEASGDTDAVTPTKCDPVRPVKVPFRSTSQLRLCRINVVPSPVPPGPAVSSTSAASRDRTEVAPAVERPDLRLADVPTIANRRLPALDRTSVVENANRSRSATDLVTPGVGVVRMLDSGSGNDGRDERARFGDVERSLAGNVETEKVGRFAGFYGNGEEQSNLVHDTANAGKDYVENTDNGYGRNHGRNREQSKQIGNTVQDYGGNRSNGYAVNYGVRQEQSNPVRNTENANNIYGGNTGNGYGVVYGAGQRPNDQMRNLNAGIVGKDHDERVRKEYARNYGIAQEQSGQLRYAGNVAESKPSEYAWIYAALQEQSNRMRNNNGGNKRNEYASGSGLEQNGQMHDTGNSDYGDGTNNGYADNYAGNKEASDQTNNVGNTNNGYVDNLFNVMNDCWELRGPSETFEHNCYIPPNSGVVDNERFEITKIGDQRDVAITNVLGETRPDEEDDDDDFAKEPYDISEALLGFGKVKRRRPVIAAGNSSQNVGSVDSNGVSLHNVVPPPMSSSSSSDW